MKKDLSLYIHIPFCAKKCKYCDFLSSDCETYGTQLRYVTALCQEILMYAPMADRYQVKTIFFGGGTPSLLDESLIQNIMSAIRRTFDVDPNAEITIEANPGTVMHTKLLAYLEMGINRLSIGLQSADDGILANLGRIHNYDQFVSSFRSARRAGFQNINVDIMSGLPGQDMHGYAETLYRVMEYAPEHISAYSLIVEEGTPLSEDEELLNLLPSEYVDRQMYSISKKLLAANGYERYEFSNYSKPGYECKHNIVYWTGGQYVGFGVGASSYFKGERFSNIKDIQEYIHLMETSQPEIASSQDPFLTYEKICMKLREEVSRMYLERRMEEFMFLGLRMTRGISRKRFERLFNRDIYDVYGPVINKYIEEGFLEYDGDRIYLNDKGIDVSNIILADFLLD